MTKTFRYINVVVRVLFGALFAFSGFTGLFGIGSQSTDGMSAEAVAFATALGESGFVMPVVKVAELVAGIMLLVNRFVPLALALLAPLVVGVFGFHLLLEPSGAVIAVVLAVVEIYLAWVHRDAFVPMLRPAYSQEMSSLSRS
ncbi:DoxX family membrane protein [Lentzea californiensis]|uniref:DoxX family membrane protein n=1 Tax=Lentzea californiensis TaxID=438851 RepID=UPI002165136F|nr:DoxX family membrane protein [Lentzea californiensis]MCR3750882.1 DoxX protein [Lentzea californiensis]